MAMTTAAPTRAAWLVVGGAAILAVAAAADLLPWLLIAVAGAAAVWVGIFTARG